MRFELIDQILDRQDQRLVAVKTVTLAEEYLGDHFPSFPVLPGVMMLEALVQAGRLLISGRSEGQAGAADCPQGKPLVLAEVRNVRYGNMVRPGQSLRIEVSIRKQDAAGWDMEGVGSVNDQVAVQGRFRLAPLPQ